MSSTTSTLTPRPRLSFTSLNSSASTTLVLLHGSFSSRREFSLIAPYLARSFHVLIPDLPGHGQSSSIPFSFDAATALLVELIITEAKNGRAHIAAMSLGAFTALHLARRHPDVVLSLFATGCGRSITPWTRWRLVRYWATGALMVGILMAVVWLPARWYAWVLGTMGMQPTEGLQEDQRSVAGYGSMVRILEGLKDFDLERVEDVGARILVIAAGLDDDLPGTLEMGERLRKGNHESRACKVGGMRHVWTLQDPDLFARGVEAWAEEKELPKEFEVLATGGDVD